ncbi:MAG: hypothetical protein IKP00_07150 [Victivallales bacterium]|nr:hypothetical protein [Victivallales bacterium]
MKKNKSTKSTINYKQETIEFLRQLDNTVTDLESIAHHEAGHMVIERIMNPNCMYAYIMNGEMASVHRIGGKTNPNLSSIVGVEMAITPIIAGYVGELVKLGKRTIAPIIMEMWCETSARKIENGEQIDGSSDISMAGMLALLARQQYHQKINYQRIVNSILEAFDRNDYKAEVERAREFFKKHFSPMGEVA